MGCSGARLRRLADDQSCIGPLANVATSASAQLVNRPPDNPSQGAAAVRERVRSDRVDAHGDRACLLFGLRVLLARPCLSGQIQGPHRRTGGDPNVLNFWLLYFLVPLRWRAASSGPAL